MKIRWPKSKKFYLVFGALLIAGALLITIPTMNMSCDGGTNICAVNPELCYPYYDYGDCVGLGGGLCIVAGDCCDAAAACPAGICCLLDDTSASICDDDIECCSGNCDVGGTDTCCLPNDIVASACTADTECCGGNCDVGGTDTCCVVFGGACTILDSPDPACCTGHCSVGGTCD